MKQGTLMTRIVMVLMFLAVCLYAAFYPVLIGLMVPTWYTSDLLKWFPSWPF